MTATTGGMPVRRIPRLLLYVVAVAVVVIVIALVIRALK